MIIKLFIFLMILTNTLLAKSHLISSLPLPKTYVQDLSLITCHDECLKQDIKQGFIFSFLAHSSGILQDKYLNNQRLINISLFNIGSVISSGELKIALLLPYKIIGRYAASTTTSVFSYLLARNRIFDIKSFNIDTQDKDTMASELNKIENQGYLYIIAPLTKKGVNAVISINPKIDIFFPTINKNDVNSTSSYLYFGGINYHAQLDMLLKHIASPLVIFHDNSSLSRSLSRYAKNSVLLNTKQDNILQYTINNRSSNLRYMLKNNLKIQHGSFLMNTPVVKTGMAMSQLTLYDVNSTNILSTQINYNPLILSMTQYQDRKNMIITNSILNNNDIITQTNKLLNNDIQYNWINYATTIGIDYFFHLITGAKREYQLPIVNNQIIYPIQLIKPSYSRFIPYGHL